MLVFLLSGADGRQGPSYCQFWRAECRRRSKVRVCRKRQQNSQDLQKQQEERCSNPRTSKTNIANNGFVRPPVDYAVTHGGADKAVSS